MRILHIVFLLGVCGCPQARRQPISDILEIPKLSKYVTIHVAKMIHLLDKVVGLPQKVEAQKVLFKEMKVINNKIDMLNVQLSGSQFLKVIANYDVQSQRKVKELIENIDFIYLKYKDMVTFIESNAAFEDFKSDELDKSIGKPRSLQSVLNKIHAIIGPGENEDYSGPSDFKTLIQKMRDEHNYKIFCNRQTSEQQFILYLYNTLALTELKGFLMIEFSYMLLQLHDKGNFTKEIQSKKHWYKDRSATTLKSTIEAVQSAPTEFWNCDTRHNYVKNETYIEITQILQAYIENEQNLYELNRIRSCYYNCKPPRPPRVYDCKDGTTFCKRNRKCDGEVINCHPIANGRVCLADAGTNRRYEYITTDKDLGGGGYCGKNSVEFTNWHWWGYFINCDYCLCFCDGGKNADRFFNLRSSESDIDQNMVVTGLRFVKKNRIIHLQIQEGKLLPNAQIDGATVHWKPVDNYRIVQYSTEVLVNRDFHEVTWFTPGVDLDDLVAKADELVTGVRFTIMDERLHFDIRITGFNFTTGTLKVGNSTWLSNGRKDRKKINLDNKNIPIRSPGPYHRVSESGMYLEFTHSDLVMDAAQTAVPFIDAHAVASALPVPLSGAGIMYRGSNTNYAGFITPKIMTYDYSKLLRNAYDNTNYNYVYV